MCFKINYYLFFSDLFIFKSREYYVLLPRIFVHMTVVVFFSVPAVPIHPKKYLKKHNEYYFITSIKILI